MKSNKNQNTKQQCKEKQPQERYQNLVTDYSFKFVFTQKQFLIPFLNELLQGNEKIESIDYINTECLGKTPTDRSVVFDVYCRNERGEHILLEMQNLYQKHFIDRSIFYSSHLIQQQGIKGEWDYELKTIYVIGVLNFVPQQMQQDDSPVCRVKLTNIDTKEIFSEKLNFIFLSLPKFIKTADELQSHLDYWFYAMIHSQPNRNLNEQVLRKDKLFAKLLDVIELNKLTKTEMKKYQQSKLTYEDLRPYAEGHYELGMADGMQQGMQQGLQRGMQQGAEQERSQTALNALKEGLSMQIVSKITSLSVSEIEKLKSRM